VCHPSPTEEQKPHFISDLSRLRDEIYNKHGIHIPLEIIKEIVERAKDS
jgi:hypothetical protein